MERVAAIDCGTNSLRLLIAEQAQPGDERSSDVPLRDLAREMRIVRLGEGVDSTGRLSDVAVARTLAGVDEYIRMIEDLGAETIRFVGTSAMRDATNGTEFMAAVQERLGVVPEVIPGSEEASLSFQGATATLAGKPVEPVLLVDIGGGSTEFVVGEGTVDRSVSVDMGSVRVMERFGTDFFNKSGLRDASDWVDSQLDAVSDLVRFGELGSVVGVAGTVTTLAAWVLGVPTYSPELTHGQLITWDSWEEAAEFMITQPTEVKAALPVMPPGREDVIGAGAIVWRQILRRVKAETGVAGRPLIGAYVSEHDILDGIALSLLQGAESA